MKETSRLLRLRKLDSKSKPYSEAADTPPPGEGWINGIRTALNMTLGQLAKKAGVTTQSVKDFETREKQGTITVNSLKQLAEALDMQLVYAIIPKVGTIEDKVDGKAEEKAREIVHRTANTMALEDQGISSARLTQALYEKKNELKDEIPKFLWD